MIDITNPRLEDFARAGGLTPVTQSARTARCTYCSKEFPSSPSLAFFEFRGEGSREATEHCKCGYTLGCHDEAHPHVLKDCTEPTPTPRGPQEFDRFYCGCRGWD